MPARSLAPRNASPAPRPLPDQWAALLLRLALGTMYIAHALFKILVLGWPGVIKLFSLTGMPEWMTYPAVAAELLGGLLLILGIGVRWVALALLPMLLGAIAFVHGAHGWIYTSPGGGWEYLAFLAVVSLALVCLGNGALSLAELFKAPAKGQWMATPAP
ncbi:MULTISPECIES: DoxX family membrane protein [unclassified Pseudomonas]|uniref:DoxX family protein n=1 Tax=unclassified Pseudomonas TaxID=196821 RepID=UPI000838B7C5|nr:MULTISPECIES: DoxX family membrane protein [unclassified Pseudomonas]QIH05368.1 DoxX family membrane protein [Pseudomonas sp. BIOMIG1BAC]